MANVLEQTPRIIEYPSSDGKPMAETDWHRNIMVAVIHTLQGWFATRSDVYVTGNLLVYYVEGDPRKHLSPDCFVAFGVPKIDRDIFKTWEEGKYPDVVIEITSKTTKREDVTKKHRTYRDVWKVREYFLFDPLEDYLEPTLQGFRLQGGEFVPMPLVDGQLSSDVLGLRLERNGIRLQFRDPATGREVLTPAEEEVRRAREQADLAESKAAMTESRLTEANHEIEELRRQLAARQTKDASAN